MIRLLDCTLRDGAYITNSMFGESVMRGIICKLQEAHIEYIECGWLKNDAHENGSTFYHVPADIENYIMAKSKDECFTAMIDWDRYDVDILPICDHKTIDAVRVVFPHGKHSEAIGVGKKIRDKGYQVLFQAANTLAYSDEELKNLARVMNDFHPVSISVVDTFGAMYFDDLERIARILDEALSKDIKLGFHAHNNQQMAFALTVRFAELFGNTDRDIILDCTLSGIGRGAGNATTELVTSYMNRKWNCGYDLNAIMDAIDTYIDGIREKYTWGYSTPYFIAGMYECHVNNIAYLLNNHRTNARDMRNIIESMTKEERRRYDYNLLEMRYLENQNKIVNDEESYSILRKKLNGRKVMLIAPGKSSSEYMVEIKKRISEENAICIGVNAIVPGYNCDYLFFTNAIRYEYARTSYPKEFEKSKHIILSNVKTEKEEDELIFNFNYVVKRGWEHFDNAVILCLRLLSRLKVKDVIIAGFDGFKTKYNESYADENLPTLNPNGKWDELNAEILDMYQDFVRAVQGRMNISFVTESYFDRG